MRSYLFLWDIVTKYFWKQHCIWSNVHLKAEYNTKCFFINCTFCLLQAARCSSHIIWPACICHQLFFFHNCWRVAVCFSLFFRVYIVFSEINESKKKKVNSFLTQHGPCYVNVFSFFLFSPFYTRAGTQKLYQMVNLIIETKEPNGSPSSLHASGSEKRNHLWELI